MKKTLLLLVFPMLCLGAFAQDFQFAKSLGATTGNDYGKSIALDASGNTYTIGYFSGTLDFDGGTGTTELTSAGLSDIFILKLNASGDFVWAKNIGGSGEDQGLSVTLDASGTLYATGSFSSTVDFNPGVGTNNLISTGSTDIFILKLDATGNFIWAKKIGGPTADVGYSITVDAFGNVYSTGSYSGTSAPVGTLGPVDFDPGPGTFELVSTKGTPDIFTLKLDASGNFVWAKGFGNLGSDYGVSIKIDVTGNVYTTGSFSGPLGFQTSAAPWNFTLNSSGGSDVFVIKFNASGVFTWAKNLGGTGADIGTSMALDVAGNVYTTGYFSGTTDFDPGTATNNLISAGGTDLFISKLDADGNFVSAKRIGGAGNDQGNAITLDVSGNIYTTGYFNATIDFDPGAATNDLTSAGSGDIFILKLDAAGNFATAKSMGGAGDDIGYSLAVGNSGNLFSVGAYNGTADFDPGAAVFNLTSTGGSDLFISKLGFTVTPVTLLSFEVAKNEKDAYLSWKTSTELNADKFEIERSEDGLIFKKIGDVKASGNSNTIKAYHFLDKNAGANLIGQELYYRFAQLDLDGKIIYSPVRSINFKLNQTGIHVFPNPSIDVITIQAGNEQVGLNYLIADERGRKVSKGKLNNTSTRVDISRLSPGIYFVKIGDLNKETVKIIKQ